MLILLLLMVMLKTITIPISNHFASIMSVAAAADAPTTFNILIMD